MPKWDDRVLFSFRVHSIAARPDIMTARSLSLAAVRDSDVSFLRANRALRVLYLSEANSLQGIEGLSQVRELVLIHIPKVHSLEPLAALRDLRILTISTPPSWDASRKCHEVDSLDPLRSLNNLLSLSLCGIKPIHGRLRPLHQMVGLRALSISNVYSFGLHDYADLAAHLPNTVGACLRPCFSMGFEMPCRKCGKQMVGLTGTRPRTRRILCLSCDKARLLDHFDAWSQAAGREFPYPQSAEEAGWEPPLRYIGA